MANSKQFQSFLGLALMLSLLSFTPTPTWASCKNSGGSVGGHRVGSQVSGGSVTVCAAAVAVTPARTAIVKTLSKPQAKPAAKPVVKLAPAKKVVFRRTQLVPRPAPKTSTTVVVKAKAKSKTKVLTKPGSKNVTAASINFVPASVVASVYPSNQLGVGQLATFATSAAVHYRSGKLMSLPTEVRFTPVLVAWDIGGTDANGSSASFAFDAAGTHSVSVKVTYEVAYRVRGSANWILEPDTIAVTDDLFVEVTDSADYEETDSNPAPRRVLLVGEDCKARPEAFGCS